MFFFFFSYYFKVSRARIKQIKIFKILGIIFLYNLIEKGKEGGLTLKLSKEWNARNDYEIAIIVG